MRASRHQFFHPGELPLVLLSLLDAGPATGYDLMRQLTRRFAPRYKPSPGSVYPALAALQAEGLVSTDDARRTRAYRITVAGRGTAARRRDVLAQIERRVGMDPGRSDGVDSVLERLTTTVHLLSGRVDTRSVERILDRAVRSLDRLETA